MTSRIYASAGRLGAGLCRDTLRSRLRSACCDRQRCWPHRAYSEPGNITGKVIDASTKDALSFANVVVMGTNYGAMSMDDGSFFIKNVPEGVYSIKASYMGYETVQQDSVRVKAYATAQVDFKLLKTVLKSTEEVLITARRPMVEVDVPTTVRTVSEEELKTMPVSEHRGRGQPAGRRDTGATTRST